MEYLSDVELARRFAVSRVTIWRWSSQGILPKPVAIGPNSSRWVAEEVAAAEERWLAAREKRFGKSLREVEDEQAGDDTPPAPAASPPGIKPKARAKPKVKPARLAVSKGRQRRPQQVGA